MGLFDKIKGEISRAFGTNKTPEQIKAEEEEKARREEAKKFDPEGKDLEWFSSEVGLEVYKQYIVPQNYILEETVEKDMKSSDCEDLGLEGFVKVKYKDAKLPYVFFKNLVNNIKAQALEYVGPTKFLTKTLCIQAKQFYLDDDGEPHALNNAMTPELIVSVERNPLLRFAKEFDCFKLEDDIQGSWHDKFALYTDIISFLGFQSAFDKDILEKNLWMFDKETYFNELGVVRKEKGFLKKCIEKASATEYFEDKLSRLE